MNVFSNLRMRIGTCRMRIYYVRLCGKDSSEIVVPRARI